MKKYFIRAIALIFLSLIITGCTTDDVIQERIKENTQEKVDHGSTEEDSKKESSKSKEEISVGEDFSAFIAGNPRVEELISYIKVHISKADEETADEMLYRLIDLQYKRLEDETNYFYRENSLDIQKEIAKAYDKITDKFTDSYAIIGENKYMLIDNIENKEIAAHIKALFERGYGLYSGEGTYYPVIDYKVLKDTYSSNVTNMTSKYLDFMTKELKEPTTIEAYLSVNINKLKERVFKYEEYLKDYSTSPYIEDIRMNYMICVWKLVNPSIYDGMLDEDYSVSNELNEVYRNILEDDSHPITVEAVKGITEFIESNNGILGSLDNTDELYEVSYKLHSDTIAKIDTLYLQE